jgi:hypothetical protein
MIFKNKPSPESLESMQFSKATWVTIKRATKGYLSFKKEVTGF